MHFVFAVQLIISVAASWGGQIAYLLLMALTIVHLADQVTL
jgi:hypothetical protein